MLPNPGSCGANLNRYWGLFRFILLSYPLHAGCDGGDTRRKVERIKLKPSGKSRRPFLPVDDVSLDLRLRVVDQAQLPRHDKNQIVRRQCRSLGQQRACAILYKVTTLISGVDSPAQLGSVGVQEVVRFIGREPLLTGYSVAAFVKESHRTSGEYFLSCPPDWPQNATPTL